MIQDFILHDALLWSKSALEQIASGMEAVGVLKLILNDSQKKTADMLKQFINTSTTDGNTTLCKLLEPFREYLVLI